MEEAQRLAAAIVLQVLNGTSLDAALRAMREKHPGLSPPHRALVQELSFGTLRYLGHVDALLDALLTKPLRDERLRSLLRVALYQLEYTRAAAHTVVDQAVLATARLGHTAAKGLVNAVLRNFLRRRGELNTELRRSETARFSYPRWWIIKLRQQYPQRYGAILEAGNLHPPMTLRVNRRRLNASEYLARLHAGGITAHQLEGEAITLEKPRPVVDLPGFAEGLVSVQDASAQRAAYLLDLKAGQTVLDASAAPGGKSAHILELADVRLTALDVDLARLERLRANMQRLGLAARLAHGDATDPSAWWGGVRFDRILADVPCSASGVVKRHPDIKWLRRPSDIPQFAALQARVLEALWQLLAAGGKLLYATCSVFSEENQLQIDAFLERHSDVHRLTLPGDDINREQPAGQILPDERHDGFYYALLQKR